MIDPQDKIDAKKHAMEKKLGFDHWFENPMTKALISTLPPMENFDMFKALLEACFSSAFDMGKGVAMMDLITAVLKKDKPNA